MNISEAASLRRSRQRRVKLKVSRAARPELIAGLSPCVIGMKAYSGAHYWAILFRQYDHEPRLIAAKFVSPYRMAGKSGKNDAADAQAICEAVRRLHMRFVPVKDESKQCHAFTVPGRVLSKRKQQHITD